MYMVLVYDITDGSRLNRVHNICGKYLFWVQNSVFEGDISDSNSAKLQKEIRETIKKSAGDSVIVYEINYGKIKRIIIGVEKNKPTYEFW